MHGRWIESRKGLLTKILLIAAGLACSTDANLTAAVLKDTGDTELRTSIDGQLYWVEELARGLKFPASLSWLPDGKLLIAERQGGLRLYRDGKLDPNAVVGVPTGLQDLWSGFKEVIVDPDHQINRRIYLLISEGTQDRLHTAVYRARYEQGRLTEVERIFKSRGVAAVYSTGRMLLLPDKTLLVAVTDARISPRPELPQRLDSDVGKILRINLDGSIPADNPFLNTPNALPEIWSYGHRVETGLHWDAESQSVWEVEPGPAGGDELNLLKAGGNFGWAKASWGFDYDGEAVTPQRSGAGIENPIVVWMPSVTPSGLTRYRGATYPAWNGDFFVGYLAGRAVERLRIEDRRAVFRERMLADLNERIREIRVGPDNRIYILTDNQNGRLLRLNPGRPGATEHHRAAQVLEPDRSAAIRSEQPQPDAQTPDDFQAGKQAFFDRCAGCHSIGSMQNRRTGPDLNGVYGRRAAGAAGFAYSGALATFARVWNDKTLDQFLADPGRYVPGTMMAAPPISDPDVRRRIIAFIKQEGHARK